MVKNQVKNIHFNDLKQEHWLVPGLKELKSWTAINPTAATFKKI